MAKNIAEKMMEKYEQVQAEKDIGLRLLKLDALQVQVQKIIGNNDKNLGMNEFMTSGSAVGVAVGAAMVATGHFDVSDVGIIGDYLFGSGVCGLAGLWGGMLTRIGAGDAINRRLGFNRAAKHVTEVLPHLPHLKAIVQEISNDKNAILKTDKALDLQQSPVLKELIKTYPDLVRTFTAAHDKKPIPQIKTVPQQKTDSPLQL